jgi:hypothetical protein
MDYGAYVALKLYRTKEATAPPTTMPAIPTIPATRTIEGTRIIGEGTTSPAGITTITTITANTAGDTAVIINGEEATTTTATARTSTATATAAAASWGHAAPPSAQPVSAAVASDHTLLVFSNAFLPLTPQSSSIQRDQRQSFPPSLRIYLKCLSTSCCLNLHYTTIHSLHL